MNNYSKWEDFLSSEIINWHNTTMGNIFSHRKEKNRPELPLLSVTGEGGVVDRDTLERRDTSNADKSKYLTVLKGDIVYNTMRMWQGVSGCSPKDGLVSPAYTVLCPNESITPDFAKYLVKDAHLIQVFHKNSQGLVDDTLNLKFKNLSSIKVKIPPLTEQVKIASILNSMDKAIETTKKQLKKVQDLKKATLNELLTKGIGHKEFKESELGIVPMNWKIMELSKVAKILSSNVDKKTKENEISVLLCNYMDVYKNLKITREINFMKASAKKSEIDKFLIKKDDVIITKDSERPDDIAISSYVSENFDNVLCGYHLSIIRPNKSILNGKFLSLFFKLDHTKHRFSILANGTTRFGLNLNEIENSKILLPSLEEQENIANIVFSLDDKISIISKRFNKYIFLKRSLMQNLLKGKVRIKTN